MRGSAFDVLVLLVIATTVIMVGFYSLVINTGVINGLNSSNNFTADENYVAVKTTNAQKTFVTLIPFLILALGIGSIILAWFIPTNPIFMPIGLFLLAIFIFISAFFSNFLFDFLSTASIAPYANEFPLIVQIVRNLPTLTLVMGVVIFIVQYGRGNSQSGEI